MTIIHICLGSGFGGQERQFYELIKQLQESYNQVVVIKKYSPLWNLCKDLREIKIVSFNRFLRFLTLSRFNSVFDTKEFTIIHAHSKRDSKLADALRKKFRCPYIVTFRNCGVYNYKNYIRTWYNADKLIPVSNFLKDLLKYSYPRYIDTRPVETAKYKCVIPDSFSIFNTDTEKINKLRQKYHGKFVIGCVARLDKIKGHSHIINVARRFFYTCSNNFHFLIIGSGPEEKKLRKQAEGLSNVEFTGFKINVGDYYSVFDLFVLFSVQEALGSCILDAFNYNVPVVASDAGGIPEIVKHEQTGLLCDIRNENQLYDAIARLHADSDLRQKIIENAKVFVKNYSIENQAKAYIDIYKEIHDDLER
jgi:glycosyltransferase involved in cell wall biosynthesis